MVRVIRWRARGRGFDSRRRHTLSFWNFRQRNVVHIPAKTIQMKSSMTFIQSNGWTEIDLILKQKWRRFIWWQVSFKYDSISCVYALERAYLRQRYIGFTLCIANFCTTLFLSSDNKIILSLDKGKLDMETETVDVAFCSRVINKRVQGRWPRVREAEFFWRRKGLGCKWIACCWQQMRLLIHDLDEFGWYWSWKEIFIRG